MKYLTNPFFICLLFSLLSCTKEKIITIETERKYNWKELEQFSYFSKIQLNSHSNDGNLLIMGINSLTQIEKNVTAPDSIDLKIYLLPLNNTVFSKLPISDDIFLGNNGNKLSLNTCYNLGGNAYTEWINLSEIDSLSAGISSIDAFRGDNIGLNTAHQCLVPYDRYIDNTNAVIQKGSNFFIITCRIEKTEFEQIQVDKIDKLSFSPEKGDLFKIESIDEYFFIVLAYNTYRIDKNMDVKLVHEGLINDIFRDGQKYVATGASGFLYSYDEGITWQKKADETDTYFRYATYVSIDDRIIAFINGQIWECDFGENEIVLKELDNDGLEGNKITSISKFENQIYVTSLSGVFNKSATKFFQYK